MPADAALALMGFRFAANPSYELWRVEDLHLAPVSMSILRVLAKQVSPNNEWSPNNARFEIHFYRDGGVSTGQTFRLFEYHAIPDGGGVYPDASFRVWDIRFTGSIADFGATTYDKLKIVKFNDNSGISDPANHVPSTNIWFDVYNLPKDQNFAGTPLAGYTWANAGPWSRLVAPWE